MSHVVDLLVKRIPAVILDGHRDIDRRHEREKGHRKQPVDPCVIQDRKPEFEDHDVSGNTQHRDSEGQRGVRDLIDPHKEHRHHKEHRPRNGPSHRVGASASLAVVIGIGVERAEKNIDKIDGAERHILIIQKLSHPLIIHFSRHLMNADRVEKDRHAPQDQAGPQQHLAGLFERDLPRGIDEQQHLDQRHARVDMELNDDKNCGGYQKYRRRLHRSAFLRDHDLDGKQEHTEITDCRQKPSVIEFCKRCSADIKLTDPKYKPGIKENLLQADSDPSYIEL